jgi:hypothetical protein
MKTPTTNQSQEWNPVSTACSQLSDVLNVTVQDRQLVTELLISSSFFLPKEVLARNDLRVSQIACLTLEDFANFYEQIIDMPQLEFYSDCKYQLLAYAKLIGVSARKNLHTGKLHILCKIWYGEDNITGKGYNHEYEQRKFKLFSFCNLTH